jgi:L-lactate dehydrogenase complex protein LldG
MSASAKAAMLQRLNQVTIESPQLPEVIEGDWITFADPVTKLQEVIAFVGGICKVVADESEILADLQQYDEFKSASLIWSNTDAVQGNVDLNQIERPHDLERVDFAIYRSSLAVAENGAAWVSDTDIRHRVIFFIAQHLVIIVRRADIVHNLHEAYSKISIPKPGFGVFVSGPSKTADIEQSLVIGAHGCRSMIMYIV